MMVYMIRLSKKKKESDFEKFMGETVFPGIPKVQLRSGKIDGLVLLKGNNTGVTNHYLLFAYGGVNGGAVDSSLKRIHEFGARVIPLHMFEVCVRWFAGDYNSKSEDIWK